VYIKGNLEKFKARIRSGYRAILGAVVSIFSDFQLM